MRSVSSVRLASIWWKGRARKANSSIETVSGWICSLYSLCLQPPCICSATRMWVITNAWPMQVSKVSDTSCYRYSLPGFSILSVSIPALLYCWYLLKNAIILILADHKYSHLPRNGSACSMDSVEAPWYQVSKVSNLCASVSIPFPFLVSANH